MEKRLYKSDEDRVLCGVCGGIAEFFGLSSTSIRIFWIIFIGASIWLYIALAIIIPSKNY